MAGRFGLLFPFRPAAEAFLKGETRLYSDPGFGFYVSWIDIFYPLVLLILAYRNLSVTHIANSNPGKFTTV